MTGVAKTVIDTNGRYIDVLTDPILAGEDACSGGRIEHLVKSINQKRAMVYSRMLVGDQALVAAASLSQAGVSLPT